MKKLSLIFSLFSSLIISAQCPTGTKVVVQPFGGDNTDFLIETADYPGRAHKYPTFSYPNLVLGPNDTLALDHNFIFKQVQLFGYEGSPGCPIVITCDEDLEETIIREKLTLADCKHIKITGRRKGDNNFNVDTNGTHGYNLKIVGDLVRGVNTEVIGFVDDIEEDKVYHRKGWYGGQWKTDPFQDPYPGCDTFYSYPHHRMTNLRLHHSYFEDFTQDVLYVGNTDPTGERLYNCFGELISLIPFRLGQVEINHNRIVLAGRTAIQLGGCDSGYNKIHHNYITDVGDEFNQGQGNGIALGHSSNVHVYNNFVKRSFLFSYTDFGIGKNYWYNNFSDSAGVFDFNLNTGIWETNNPGKDRDSFLANTPSSFIVSGHYVLNIYATGIPNFASSAKPSFPVTQKEVEIYGNTFGFNTSPNDDEGAIVFYQWGPDDWGPNNIICSNEKIVGGPVTVSQYNFYDDSCPCFTGIMKPSYSTTPCPADIPPNPSDAFKRTRRIR